MVWTIKEQSLYWAIKNGSISEINQAIQNGADVNTKDIESRTPLMFALRYEAPKKVIELLIAKGAYVNAKDKIGWTPLMYACSYDAPKEVIELLINNKADVNKKSNYGKTPLMYACKYNASKELIELLIAKGAKVKAKDKVGQTPLMLAKEFNAPKEVIELLKEAPFIALKANLAKLEQENANLKQKIDEQNLNNLQAKKIAKQRMRALRLGQYRHR